MNDVFSAALVGALIGTFFGGFTKFLWERLVPDWMTWRRTRRLERDHQLATIRAPAYLALADLQGRLRVIAESQAHNYKYAEAIGEGDYYVRSTAYMVGRAFAWQVILRERMASYDYADLYRCLEQLTQAHSHGQPGFQIFRLDQREIGERMLTDLRAAEASVLPFSEFLDRMDEDGPARWLVSLDDKVTALLEHPYDELDRVEAIDEALTKTLVLIDAKRRWIPDDVTLRPIDAEAIRIRLAAED
jgi:hypothetical protein